MENTCFSKLAFYIWEIHWRAQQLEQQVYASVIDWVKFVIKVSHKPVELGNFFVHHGNIWQTLVITDIRKIWHASVDA